MILRPNGPTRVAITQPDHAALAGRIVKAWRANGLPASSRRDEILLAVSEHDNGWREIDAQFIRDPATGDILDFMTVSGDIKRGVWSRAIERLSATPYAAALVAHYAAHVYGRYRSEDALIITPDPFEGAHVPLQVSGRDVRDPNNIVTITGIARGAR